jgi:hydroxymethylpyrimidine/phosphomethylpyrimidine kinase
MDTAERPKVLVIAGYDQSGGAGVLADVKTLEAHGVYGYAVCTALTFQNEWAISRVSWLPEADIFEQIDLCFDSTHFEWVKVGITESMKSASAIIRHVKQHNEDAKVILDPVIKASSGADFWRINGGWEEVAEQCYLLTPNWEEIGWLYPDGEVEEHCRVLSKLGTNVYLKGGHDPLFPGRDRLWANGEVQVLEAEDYGAPVFPKHGSGCVLASALSASLALGYPLAEAAMRAKRYTGIFLTSNQSLLGWHRCGQ